MKKQNPLTKHHIIGRCLHNQYNVHHPKNMKYLPAKRHASLHSLFQTGEPQSQLREFYEIVKSVLSPKAKRAFHRLFTMDNFYDNDAL